MNYFAIENYKKKHLVAFIVVLAFPLYVTVSFLGWKFGWLNGLSVFAIICGLLTLIIDSIFSNPSTNEKLDTRLNLYDFENLWSSRLSRYIFAAFYVSLAYALFEGWLLGSVSGKGLLLVNPIVASLIAIVGLVKAWEVALLLIAFGVLALVITGVSSLSVSLAIIVGASLIGYAISRRH